MPISHSYLEASPPPLKKHNPQHIWQHDIDRGHTGPMPDVVLDTAHVPMTDNTLASGLQPGETRTELIERIKREQRPTWLQSLTDAGADSCESDPSSTVCVYLEPSNLQVLTICSLNVMTARSWQIQSQSGVLGQLFTPVTSTRLQKVRASSYLEVLDRTPTAPATAGLESALRYPGLVRLGKPPSQNICYMIRQNQYRYSTAVELLHTPASVLDLSISHQRRRSRSNPTVTT